MKRTILLVVSVLLSFAAPQGAIAEDGKSILVTGASTGIGRNLAETLAEAGYHQFALQLVHGEEEEQLNEWAEVFARL